jgi:hypothetical protein
MPDAGGASGISREGTFKARMIARGEKYPCAAFLNGTRLRHSLYYCREGFKNGKLL